ncbi:RNA recognition motif-containing protein RRM [Tieghemostelium lacteum]|uniref:RNA recognition motif-containing protein RRM n=1 Tax=Tieghemostelium lacteum TaxID=361077 RepID=A0A151Z7F0_TIELA|nr:RNA recognition motif-containing protein RRM [Tieghemostelium lacteum]|eukprot:KYQ89714.1 RNA recognition motif-containing protein RRM [Tieghemostelium lacteum]
MVNWKFWKQSNGPSERSPLLQPNQQEIQQQQQQQPKDESSSSSFSEIMVSDDNQLQGAIDDSANISEMKSSIIEEPPSTWSNFINRLTERNKVVENGGTWSLSQTDFDSNGNNSNSNDSNNNGKEPMSNQHSDQYKHSKRFNSTVKLVKKRIPYYIPILSWLPRYNRSLLTSDVTAGITTAIMLVPQSLAYALLVGLPPIYGLYTGLMPLLTYCIFGTSRQLAVGPEALVSIIVGTTLKSISESGDEPLTIEDMVDRSNILAFLVGIFSLGLGLVRFGFLSEVLSRPLIRGFITAVALTIMIDQIDTLLGTSITSVSGWRKLPEIIKHWGEIHLLSFIISFVSIILLLAMSRIKKNVPEKRSKVIHHIIFFVPSILVVVGIGIIVSYGFKLPDKGVKVLGYYSTSFPIPKFPRLNEWSIVTELIEPAIFITIVGFVESMAVSKNFATKHNYQVSTNRELVAIGLSNMFGSLFLTYPIFASMTRSAVNDKAGAKTQLSGFFTFVVVLLTLLFLMPAFQYLPRVIMGSIIFVAAIGLCELHDIIFLWKIRAWIDMILLLGTFLTTFFFGVEIGLMVSIGASILMVIKQSSAPHFTVLGRLPNTSKYKDILIFPEAKAVEGLVIIRIEESLNFANMGHVKEILYRIENMGDALAHPSESIPNDQKIPLQGIIFDMRNIPVIDASSTHILYEMSNTYMSRNIKVCFVKLRDSHKNTFLRAGFMDLLGIDSFFSSTHEAVIKLLGGYSFSYSSYVNNTLSNSSNQVNRLLSNSGNQININNNNNINSSSSHKRQLSSSSGTNELLQFP